MTGLSIRNLRKTFGDVVAVNDLNLDIEPHSFLTLLGPSGCGKTTTLRSIGGLEEPNSGEIRIGDKIVFSSKEGMFTPPGERGIGFVFQSYALWPHMKVFFGDLLSNERSEQIKSLLTRNSIETKKDSK